MPDSDEEINSGETIIFDYKNHRGEIALRRIQPSRISFGNSAWHTVRQWLLHGFDLDKKAYRTFAMKDIRNWRTPDA